ncbi:MAG: N-acetyl-gamma-glutamyl-phosphate reductase [Clostridiales bacterium]|jgi:N-acetyl-gamma-glutamyl-phosphate reductase|nr:N-acetyl-gamma-glutamyl-phosphate reductase [Clostridiales bacterium]
MKKVFIDGREGTTGLLIYDRLADFEGIELLTLSEEERKSTAKRREMINSSDITFLCLPDDAARESVSLVENDAVKIIDTSTAHRTLPGWAYGFPELSRAYRFAIASGSRIAVPGCHASGFISAVYPLVASGAVGRDYPFVCFSVTGYTGGGKKMIAQYESCTDSSLDAPRQYATAQQHKHLKEMKAIPSLENEPVFCPVVANYPRGMEVTVPLIPRLLDKKLTAQDVCEILSQNYDSQPLVTVLPYTGENASLSADTLAGKDNMVISVEGNDDRILIVSRFDNLGKGASAAAVQCMNILLGNPEATGLVI